MKAAQDMVKSISLFSWLWILSRKIGLSTLGKLIGQHYPFPVRANLKEGLGIFVDLRSSIGSGVFATGEFDPAAIEPAMRDLKQGGVFIDVGANIGVYSILASNRVGAEGRVFSFEIDQRPLKCLRKSVTKYGYSNIEIIEQAACDQDGIVHFEPNREHGHNSITTRSQRTRSVEACRLDTWAEKKDIQRVDWIKIDVEGAEKLVIEGAMELINKHKPRLLCECTDSGSASFGYKPDELISKFAQLGYSCTWLENVHTPVILAIPISRTSSS